MCCVGDATIRPLGWWALPLLSVASRSKRSMMNRRTRRAPTKTVHQNGRPRRPTSKWKYFKCVRGQAMIATSKLKKGSAKARAPPSPCRRTALTHGQRPFKVLWPSTHLSNITFHLSSKSEMPCENVLRARRCGLPRIAFFLFYFADQNLFCSMLCWTGLDRWQQKQAPTPASSDWKKKKRLQCFVCTRHLHIVLGSPTPAGKF